MIADSDIAARAENKVAAQIGDEAVILDIESGYYFQLNPTAARIWALLEAPISVASPWRCVWPVPAGGSLGLIRFDGHP